MQCINSDDRSSLYSTPAQFIDRHDPCQAARPVHELTDSVTMRRLTTTANVGEFRILEYMYIQGSAHSFLDRNIRHLVRHKLIGHIQARNGSSLLDRVEQHAGRYLDRSLSILFHEHGSGNKTPVRLYIRAQ